MRGAPRARQDASSMCSCASAPMSCSGCSISGLKATCRGGEVLGLLAVLRGGARARARARSCQQPHSRTCVSSLALNELRLTDTPSGSRCLQGPRARASRAQLFSRKAAAGLLHASGSASTSAAAAAAAAPVLEAREALRADLLAHDVDGRQAGVLQQLADVQLRGEGGWKGRGRKWKGQGPGGDRDLGHMKARAGAKG